MNFTTIIRQTSVFKISSLNRIWKISFLLVALLSINNLTYSQKNVILIIADDLGSDVFNSTSTKVKTNNTDGEQSFHLANLNKLKNKGIFFTNAWAHPVCSPTRGSIYTGTQPWRNGVGYADDELELTNVNYESLAKVLSDGGYKSAIFGKWHLGEDLEHTPIDNLRSWDTHVGSLTGAITKSSTANKASYTDWLKSTGTLGGTYTEEDSDVYATEDVVIEAKKWIDQRNTTENWWVTLAFNAPHDPFEVPDDAATFNSSTVTTNNDGKYNAMVQSLDYYIGKLWDNTWPTTDDNINGKLANTVFIFVGDNGTPSSNQGVTALVNGKGTSYLGGIHVPMIIADGAKIVNVNNPTFLSTGVLKTTISDMVSVVDIYKTVSEILGINISNGLGEDSRSLVPYLKGTNDSNYPVRAYNFSQTYQGNSQIKAAISNGSYKLNYQGNDTWNLFNLSNIAEGGEELIADDLIPSLSSDNDWHALGELYAQLATPESPFYAKENASTDFPPPAEIVSTSCTATRDYFQSAKQDWYNEGIKVRGTLNQQDRYRTELKFDLDSIPLGAEIIYAGLFLEIESTEATSTSGAEVMIEQLTSEPSANSNDLYNAAVSSTGTATNKITGLGKYSWNATEIVKNWVAGADNFGFRLKPTNETNSPFVVFKPDTNVRLVVITKVP